VNEVGLVDMYFDMGNYTRDLGMGKTAYTWTCLIKACADNSYRSSAQKRILSLFT